MPAETSPPSAAYGNELVIVTVTYSPGEMINRFLASVPTAYSGEPHVIMSDNGSTDGSVEAAAAEFPFATLRVNAGNLGYGGAVNAAVAHLDSSFGWILVINPDTELTPGSVDALVAAARADSTVGSAGPLIVTEDGIPYPSARQLPSLRNGVGHALFAGVWPNNPWSSHYRQDDVVARGEQVSTGWLSGACLLVRRSAFEQVGGFDDRYFMYFEDVDLGYRLGKAGWKSFYIPHAVVTHSGAHSTGTESSRMLQAHHKSAYLYLSRKYSAWYLAPLRWSLKAGLGFRSWWLTRATR